MAMTGRPFCDPPAECGKSSLSSLDSTPITGSISFVQARAVSPSLDHFFAAFLPTASGGKNAPLVRATGPSQPSRRASGSFSQLLWIILWVIAHGPWITRPGTYLVKYWPIPSGHDRRFKKTDTYDGHLSRCLAARPKERRDLSRALGVWKIGLSSLDFGRFVLQRAPISSMA